MWNSFLNNMLNPQIVRELASFKKLGKKSSNSAAKVTQNRLSNRTLGSIGLRASRASGRITPLPPMGNVRAKSKRLSVSRRRLPILKLGFRFRRILGTPGTRCRPSRPPEIPIPGSHSDWVRLFWQSKSLCQQEFTSQLRTGEHLRIGFVRSSGSEGDANHSGSSTGMREDFHFLELGSFVQKGEEISRWNLYTGWRSQLWIGKLGSFVQESEVLETALRSTHSKLSTEIGFPTGADSQAQGSHRQDPTLPWREKNWVRSFQAVRSSSRAEGSAGLAPRGTRPRTLPQEIGFPRSAELQRLFLTELRPCLASGYRTDEDGAASRSLTE